MNKTELIAEVANKAGLARKDAEKALGAVVETITEAVVKEAARGAHGPQPQDEGDHRYPGNARSCVQGR